ncbi:MAG TPA: diguanylate cyclase [Xanthomonadaceae bacterium]|nr:diguanylate cyclase [Xanthomonadaceae bacterium]
MKDAPLPETPAAKALRGEALLQKRARAALSRLQVDAIAGEKDSGGAGSELLAANEQLVLSMLRYQADIAAAQRALKKVTRSARRDALTGLPNRLLLLDRFAQAAANAKQHDTRFALLFVDLNNFKQINDTLGHGTGDEVLKCVAQVLTEVVRKTDTVSRHGGDEFLILLNGLVKRDDAAAVAQQLLVAIGVPKRMGEHVLRLSASVGISLCPDDGEEPGDLIGRADAAMYRVKRRGRAGFAFHGEKSRNTRLRPLKSLQTPFTTYELATAEHERRLVELRDANEQLALSALTAQDMRTACEQAQRRQTDFLAMVAHELRNPLAPLRIAATMLGQVGPEGLPRMQAIIESQVTHMARLVSDLVDVSRVKTGKLRIEREPMDLIAAIDEGVALCRAGMDTRLQNFVVRLPPCPIQIDGDAVRLAQVVSNLLDNASKYTPVGGEVGLWVTLEAETVVITVADSGIGITAEALPNVFEPFVQDRHATVFNATGLGLGLTVVRELVEAHGGSVAATSAGVGFGSRFIVTLPLRSPAVDATSPAAGDQSTGA